MRITEAVIEQMKNELDNLEQKWGSKTLVKIWFILQMPNYNDGMAYLGEDDILELKRLVLKLKNEIKAIKADDAL